MAHVRTGSAASILAFGSRRCGPECHYRRQRIFPAVERGDCKDFPRSTGHRSMYRGSWRLRAKRMSDSATCGTN